MSSFVVAVVVVVVVEMVGIIVEGEGEVVEVLSTSGGGKFVSCVVVVLHTHKKEEISNAVLHVRVYMYACVNNNITTINNSNNITTIITIIITIIT